MAGLRSIRRTRDSARDSPLARRFAARLGYTLVELLIVIALLSVILTLAIPSLRHLAAKSELQDAARLVRVRLLQARLQAIDSGSLTYFRYQLEGDRFEVGRAGSPSQRGQSPAGAESPLDALGGVGIEPAAEPQTLPLGMRFADPSADPQLESPATGDGLGGDASWSAPILFFPNGRTLNARIAIVSASHRAEVHVRGLTGTVQVSRAERLVSPDAEMDSDTKPVPTVSVSPNAAGAQP